MSVRAVSGPVKALCVQGALWQALVSVGEPGEPATLHILSTLTGVSLLVWSLYTWKAKSNNSAHWLSWQSVLAAQEKWCHHQPINTATGIMCCLHRTRATHSEVWKTDVSARCIQLEPRLLFIQSASSRHFTKASKQHTQSSNRVNTPCP